VNTVRPLFVSTYPPEACGLATFTRDSADAVNMAADEPVSAIRSRRQAKRLARGTLRRPERHAAATAVRHRRPWLPNIAMAGAAAA